MSESQDQSAVTAEANAATPAQVPAIPAQPAAAPAQPPAQQRPSPENSAAALLTQVHTAISALPEQLAKVLAEQNPKPVQQPAPKQAETKPAETKPAEAKAANPQKKTFAEMWFGR